MPGIGESLREARLSRGLTHEYISQVIKIRPEFLAALEEGDLAALPGNFYAKNFLRRYADFLGLDSGAVVERFVAQETAAAPSPRAAVQAGPRAPAPRRHRRVNFGLAGMLGLLAVVLAAFVARAFLIPPGRETAATLAVTPTPTDIQVAAAPTATPTSIDTPARAAATSPTPTERRAANTPRRQPTPTATARTEQDRENGQRPRDRDRDRENAPARRERTATATPEPTRTPRPKPTRTPTPEPTNTPRPRPTRTPTPEPTNTPRPRPTRTPTPSPTNTPSPEPTNTPTPRPTRTPTPADAPEPVTDGAVVANIRTTAPSAVTVRSDGRLVFNEVLAPGESETFAANANLYVYSEAAQSVLVSVNGCQVRTLDQYGCPGCVVAYYNFPRTYFDCR